MPDPVLPGRNIDSHPLAASLPLSYRKTASVLAVQSKVPGAIDTPEGTMRFEALDYIVTDDPVTHAWPVKREVFEATYERHA